MHVSLFFTEIEVAGGNLVSIVEFTAIVSAVAGLLLAVFAVVQLRHIEKHRNVDISMKLFEWAENDRLRRAFRWVFWLKNGLWILT